MTTPDYSSMTPEAREEHFVKMGADFYGTSWQHQFADHVGLGKNTVSDWKRKKAVPAWACFMLHYAIEARLMETLRAIVRGH